MADEGSARTDSRHSNSPATPNISNPGTPRTSELNQDSRITPPLPHPQITLVNPNLARATPPLPQPQQPHPMPTNLARATPPLTLAQQSHLMQTVSSKNITPSGVPSPVSQLHHHQSKYAQLLAVIEDMGRDIRPTYSGNRGSTERIKRSIIHARILVRECLMECERSARS